MPQGSKVDSGLEHPIPWYLPLEEWLENWKAGQVTTKARVVCATSVGELTGCRCRLGRVPGITTLGIKHNPNTAYQKQQGALTVWSEAEHCDLALRFQEKLVVMRSGETWSRSRFCSILTQGLTDESEEERCEATPETSHLTDLPTCGLNKREEMADSVASALSSPIRREKLALDLQTEVEMVSMLQEDEKFLSEVFAQLTDDDKLCELTLQSQNRDAFFQNSGKVQDSSCS
ncbi:LOW QUALITY PROTEIN: hypothetical protein QTO34_006701 [Cnephaeus nilssonii]|uniref:Uncharacterized protein n=1 Tax=Cnephaeus nilssonii TaxID=3371016 RepID=A0AA40LIQ3_CNENI|nr:LOW QUALITY PROTEIN: hypothetical protein QTO34_006701 [Eptesicus nilssonii]